MPANPFLTAQGLPAPLFSGGQFNPAISQMAGAFAQQALPGVTAHLEQRGLSKSSFSPILLNKAFQGGFQQAVGNFQQQQGLYNQYANKLLEMQALEDAQPRDPSFIENLLGYGLPIASVIGSFVGGR